MSNKDKVKEVFPQAYAENYKTRDPFDKSGYYLIWSSNIQRERRRLGEGKTEAKAWKDAMYWVTEK